MKRKLSFMFADCNWQTSLSFFDNSISTYYAYVVNDIWYHNVKSTRSLFDYNKSIVVQVKGSNIKGYVLKKNEHLKNV